MHTIKKSRKYFLYCLTIAAICFVQIACSSDKQESSNSAQPISDTGQTKAEDQSKAKVQEVNPAEEPQPAQSNPASKPAGQKQQPQQTQQPQTAQQAPPPRPVREEPPPPPRTYTMDVGTRISVITTNTLSTKNNQNGDTFVATLAQPIEEDGWVIADRGATVEGVILNSDPGGRVSGVAEMTVALKRLTLADGRTINISTDSYLQKAKTSKKKDAIKIGAGAGIGAAIGAIAGGGKGAAIGAAVGGGAGTAHTVATHGDAAVINSEQRLNFTLKSPVTITKR